MFSPADAIRFKALEKDVANLRTLIRIEALEKEIANLRYLHRGRDGRGQQLPLRQLRGARGRLARGRRGPHESARGDRARGGARRACSLLGSRRAGGAAPWE